MEGDPQLARFLAALQTETQRQKFTEQVSKAFIIFNWSY